jgi:phosphoserine aminotransferase
MIDSPTLLQLLLKLVLINWLKNEGALASLEKQERKNIKEIRKFIRQGPDHSLCGNDEVCLLGLGF